MLRMLDLFSGIGGFSYAGEKLVGGYETVAFCEYDKHCQRVLRKHWPDTEIIDDVRELANDAERFRGSVDIICGGYPCQPFSLAGVRRGDKDDRHLWPEMLRIIQAVRPTWVCGENVAGHITMGLDTVLSDLEAEGYQARCFVIPAVGADAYHRRDRCWVVAHTNNARNRASQRAVDKNQQTFEQKRQNQSQSKFSRCSQDVANAGCKPKGGKIAGFGNKPINSATKKQRSKARDRFGNGGWWQPEPSVGRVVNGVPGRVHRLKQLGNSIVPQVAARILWAIKEAHDA